MKTRDSWSGVGKIYPWKKDSLTVRSRVRRLGAQGNTTQAIGCGTHQEWHHSGAPFLHSVKSVFCCSRGPGHVIFGSNLPANNPRRRFQLDLEGADGSAAGTSRHCDGQTTSRSLFEYSVLAIPRHSYPPRTARTLSRGLRTPLPLQLQCLSGNECTCPCSFQVFLFGSCDLRFRDSCSTVTKNDQNSGKVRQTPWCIASRDSRRT